MCVGDCVSMHVCNYTLITTINIQSLRKINNNVFYFCNTNDFILQSMGITVATYLNPHGSAFSVLYNSCCTV